jgi:hypothetical protein
VTTVGIIQPNFIPWRGYFDFIREVDVFVILDDVQYTAQDWRNRNRVRRKDGASRWLTVPVTASHRDLIKDVQIAANTDWRAAHLNFLKENYRAAPHRDEVLAMLEEAYRRHKNLADLDVDLCKSAMTRLAITTPIVRSSELAVGGVKDERLIGITRRLGGRRYLSGPAAKAYIQPRHWDAAGIELAYKTYPDYPAYPQIAEPFDPYVSVIDLLMMEGDKAAGLLGDQAPDRPPPGETGLAGKPM